MPRGIFFRGGATFPGERRRPTGSGARAYRLTRLFTRVLVYGKVDPWNEQNGVTKMKAKVPITMRALTQRINRALLKQDERLYKSRGMQMYLDVGDFYVVDLRGNWVAGKDVDPEELGRELGVLKEYERVVDEG